MIKYLKEKNDQIIKENEKVIKEFEQKLKNIIYVLEVSTVV
jgi:hypothetical protein